ncbi:13_t:CDS:2 [Racocetra fulgida]|uniref:13_t:CDS:1 n=1 Tax=Racocetra fulgida TaxID=60492 RepID=A0A9N9EZ44_9GLOM|nr:13_t:CDS:2 [Racocetra fulgida]
MSKITIVSGDQPGIERAALDVALENQLKIEGYCLPERLAEDEALPERYPLKPLDSKLYSESNSSLYSIRNEENFKLADKMLVLNIPNIKFDNEKLPVIEGKESKIILLEEKNFEENIQLITEWLKRKKLKVAVKLLNNSKDITDDFLNDFLREIEFHYKYSSINLYGLTQDQDTKNYMMVLKFADNGNLRHYLESKFKELDWHTKLFFLQKISDELVLIHKNESVHRDLHSGNILIHSNHYPCISDLGLARHANINIEEKDIYGVLPYVAPEVLCRKPYEKASDIYSFGILMTEISSGKPPHWKVPHDISLALEIINGLRPKFGKGTPKIYIKLAYQCMDADPSKRPTAGDCYELINSWCDTLRYNVKREEEISIRNAFLSADKKGSGSSSSLQTYSNDKYTSKLLDGVYTSKLIDFKELPKPKNSDKLLELTQELTNTQDFEISSDEEKYNGEL